MPDGTRCVYPERRCEVRMNLAELDSRPRQGRPKVRRSLDSAPKVCDANGERPLYPVRRPWLNASRGDRLPNSVLALELLVAGVVEREDYLRNKR